MPPFEHKPVVIDDDDVDDDDENTLEVPAGDFFRYCSLISVMHKTCFK